MTTPHLGLTTPALTDAVDIDIPALANDLLLIDTWAGTVSGGSGTVTSIANAASDTTLTIAGTSSIPTIKVTPGTFDAAGAATAAAATKVQVGGDIGGTITSPTIAKLQGTVLAAPPGGTSEYLRGDGTWATTYKAYQFAVSAAPYNAVGDNSTNDLVAINAAMTAMTTYLATHYYAELIFDSDKCYFINGTPSGASSGNAFIPIPLFPDTGVKRVIALKGTQNSSVDYHWLQTATQGQIAGATIRTTYAAGTSPTSGNEPCVIGGPNPHGGYGFAANLYTNVVVIVDGLNIAVPQDPECSGLDFRGLAGCSIPAYSYLCTSTSGLGAPTIPDANSGFWSAGLLFPEVNNNDICDFGAITCEGAVQGVVIGEHVSGDTLRVVNCFDGAVFSSASTAPHASIIRYLSAENCVRHIATGGSGNNVLIECFDVEPGTSCTSIINDPTNVLSGTIRCFTNGTGTQLNANILNAAYAPSGGSQCAIYNGMLTPGVQTAPAAPATTVAIKNPFWRDAFVTLNGGTVTAVKIDTITVGTALTTYMLPTGHSISVTYTGTLTWSWVVI